jgi:glutathione S-transferase
LPTTPTEKCEDIAIRPYAGVRTIFVGAAGNFGGLDTADFVAMNPHGRVPLIRDGDAMVWESHAVRGRLDY